jgi:BirA family biotin operon repressor/biotin-[acetyl-CoA-carboxylase] ligase
MADGGLQLDRLRQGLHTRRLGKRIEYVSRTTSTNDVATSFISGERADGLVVLTDEQTAGRGRMGRTWVSPYGASLLMSVVLLEQGDRLPASALSLSAGLAVHDALALVVDRRPAIKWPNDVLFDQKKVAGVLVEAHSRGEAGTAYVVGIGINCQQRRGDFPPELADQATSIALVCGRNCDRTHIAVTVLDELDRWWASPNPDDWSRLKEAWLARTDLLNSAIRLRFDGVEYRGVVRDLEPATGLLVELADGTTRWFRAEQTSVLQA